ncbi:MAG: GNAT family N-acetyltransferase [Alphaproteobacteria bacterium]|nr:GNAT family N-acetyltransferase [Alphaproteobacteria bacterium]
MSVSSSVDWPYATSQAGTANAWQVEIFTDPAALEESWLRLTLEGHAGPFQTFGWLSAWYKAATRYDLAEPLILTGSRRADGRPDIILPLCRYKAYGCTIISSPDLGVSDLYEPVLNKALPGDGSALETFFKQARQKLPPHDMIFISKLEATADGTAPSLAPPRFLAQLPYFAWSLDLCDGEDPDKLVKSKTRRSVRQKINQMQRAATREIEVHDEQIGADTLDTIFSMRAERLSAINRPDGLKLAAWRQLYEEICTGQHADLKPSSTLLLCDNQPVGAQLGIQHKGHFVGTLLSFKMGPYERYSPGMQVVFENVRRLAQSGARRFDLSGGDQPYKRQLGCTPRPLFEMMVPGSFKGTVLWALWHSKNKLKSYPRLFNALKRIRGLAVPRH